MKSILSTLKLTNFKWIYMCRNHVTTPRIKISNMLNTQEGVLGPLPLHIAVPRFHHGRRNAACFRTSRMIHSAMRSFVCLLWLSMIPAWFIYVDILIWEWYSTERMHCNQCSHSFGLFLLWINLLRILLYILLVDSHAIYIKRERESTHLYTVYMLCLYRRTWDIHFLLLVLPNTFLSHFLGVYTGWQCKSPALPHSFQWLCMAIPFHFSHSVRCTTVSPKVLTCLSLIANDSETFHMHVAHLDTLPWSTCLCYRLLHRKKITGVFSLLYLKVFMQWLVYTRIPVNNSEMNETKLFRPLNTFALYIFWHCHWEEIGEGDRPGKETPKNLKL